MPLKKDKNKPLIQINKFHSFLLPFDCQSQSHFRGILLSGECWEQRGWMSSQPVMLSYTECHCGACRYSECHCELLCWAPSAALQSTVMLSVTCNCSECSYTECHYELLNSVWSAVIRSIMLNGTVLNADIMSVIMIHYRKSPMLLYKVLLCWM